MLSTPEFWVFIAFLIFLGIFGKKAFVLLTQAIDGHREKVAYQLTEAQRLNDEALSLLNSYKKKHEEAIEQSKKIIALAEWEAQELKKTSQKEFEKFMSNKEKAILDRIEVEKEEAKSQLRDQVLNEAIAIIETHLLKDSKERTGLTDASLKELSQMKSLKP